jgi:uncharacterized RDD family membrane protein YckC
MDALDTLEFVGIWKRAWAVLIDAAIVLPFTLLGLRLDYWALENNAAWAFAAPPIVGMVLSLWFVVRFGGTPGKLLLGIRILNRDLSFLAWGPALRRDLPLIASLVIATAAFNAAASQFQGFNGEATFGDYADALMTLGQPYSGLQSWCAWFGVVDIGVILLNKRRRAIHDFLAGSYVVTKASYLRAQPSLHPVTS